MFVTRCSLLAVSSLLASALPAFAHAHPKTMIPAANSVVASPAQLSVEFSEALEPRFSKLIFTDSKGAALTKQPSTVDATDPKHMTLSLPKLPSGVYHVHWISAATDGHRMDGDYTFTVQ